MISGWKIGPALAAGNSLIIKPQGPQNSVMSSPAPETFEAEQTSHTEQQASAGPSRPSKKLTLEELRIDLERLGLDTKGKKISIRPECDESRPFGIATWSSTGAVRDIRVRMLTDAEKKDPSK